MTQLTKVQDKSIVQEKCEQGTKKHRHSSMDKNTSTEKSSVGESICRGAAAD